MACTTGSPQHRSQKRSESSDRFKRCHVGMSQITQTGTYKLLTGCKKQTITMMIGFSAGKTAQERKNGLSVISRFTPLQLQPKLTPNLLMSQFDYHVLQPCTQAQFLLQHTGGKSLVTLGVQTVASKARPPQCYQALSSTRKSLGMRLHVLQWECCLFHDLMYCPSYRTISLPVLVMTSHIPV